jgi:uncharacterized membrane protein
LCVTTAFFFCLLPASTALKDKHTNKATATAAFQPAIVIQVASLRSEHSCQEQTAETQQDDVKQCNQQDISMSTGQSDIKPPSVRRSGNNRCPVLDQAGVS